LRKRAVEEQIVYMAFNILSVTLHVIYVCITLSAKGLIQKYFLLWH